MCAGIRVAERFGNFAELREGQIPALRPNADLAMVFEQVVLGQADGVVAVIVDEENLDGKLRGDDRL